MVLIVRAVQAMSCNREPENMTKFVFTRSHIIPLNLGLHKGFLVMAGGSYPEAVPGFAGAAAVGTAKSLWNGLKPQSPLHRDFRANRTVPG